MLDFDPWVCEGRGDLPWREELEVGDEGDIETSRSSIVYILGRTSASVACTQTESNQIPDPSLLVQVAIDAHPFPLDGVSFGARVGRTHVADELGWHHTPGDRYLGHWQGRGERRARRVGRHARPVSWGQRGTHASVG